MLHSTVEEVQSESRQPVYQILQVSDNVMTSVRNIALKSLSEFP